VIAPIVLRLRRRAAALARDAAKRMRQEAGRLQGASGAIAGCGCTDRFDWCCSRRSLETLHCTCDCHDYCHYCSPEVNARRRRDS